VLLLLAAATIPAPAPEEPRPLAPAENEWDARSGALVEAGIGAMMRQPFYGGASTSSIAVLRAGMHEYGLEWTVGGALGTTFADRDDTPWEAIATVGGRVQRPSRAFYLLRGTAGVFSIAADQGFALGAEGGGGLALGRVVRFESVLLVRAATGIEGKGLTPLIGGYVAVVVIP